MGNAAPDIARNIDKSQLSCCRVLDHPETAEECRECTTGTTRALRNCKLRT